MNMHAKPLFQECTKVLETEDGAAVQKDDFIHTLNEPAFEILRLCDGSRTVGEIIEEMTLKYENADLAELVTTCVMQLEAAGIVTIPGENGP